MSWRSLLVLVSICGGCLWDQSAWAGYIEIGASGSYKKSFFDDPSYDQTTAFTASVDYLFTMMSALELSYTNGQSTRFIRFSDGSSRPDESTTIYYEMVGLDFVLTLADADSIVRPYVKGGGAYIIKKDIAYNLGGTVTVNTGQVGIDTGLVPSAGAGIKVAITRQFSLKAEAEGWQSSPSSNHWDVTANVGASWMF